MTKKILNILSERPCTPLERMVLKWLEYKNDKLGECPTPPKQDTASQSDPPSVSFQDESFKAILYSEPQTSITKNYQKNFSQIYTGRYQCKICDQTMKPQQMYAHMRRSHGRKPACKICGKKFHPGSLKRHVDS